MRTTNPLGIALLTSTVWAPAAALGLFLGSLALL